MAEKTLLKFWDEDKGIIIDEFGQPEIDELDKVVTNIHSNVFAWKVSDDLYPEQIGALLSRYSRTSFTGRRLFLKEFLPNRTRGKEFFETWLVDYGDDSIQEMAGGLPVACEFISNLAAKEIEDCRMGSYIEKSTRYVFFDKKLPNNDYMFYKDPKILNSPFGDAYLELMRDLFDSYVNHTPKMIDYIKEKNPFEFQKFRISDSIITPPEFTTNMEELYGITELDLKKAYENAIKANALDLMRDYLPMAALTHVGISANARLYEGLLLKLSASPLSECKWLAKQIYTELNNIVPSLIKRLYEKHGLEYQKYLSEKETNTRSVISDILERHKIEPSLQLVDLIDYTGKDKDNPDEIAEKNIVASILYKFGEGYSLKQIKNIVNDMNQDIRQKIISSYIGKRTNRRHKPGRAFENVDYVFDFCGRVGIYRDIQRHRIGTQERQNFNVRLGYDIREEFAEIGILDDYKSKMQEVSMLYDKIAKILPYQAQYVVTFGFKIHWYYKVNARQFYHFCELRTISSGHPDYRKLAQSSYLKINKIHPTIMQYMKFVDMQETALGRINSEIRTIQKKKGLESK